MSRVSKSVVEWLEARFTNNQNGIITEQVKYGCFRTIHDFLDMKEHDYQTPAIYYDAFADDSSAEFISVLAEELSCKLGSQKSKPILSLSEAIIEAGLKMVIIDKCHLHKPEITDEILTWLNQYNVCVTFVGVKSEIERTQFMDRPSLAKLPTFEADIVCTCSDSTLAMIS
ncbi:MAG: AAA family ATPase [Cyanobacteria bacterium J06629_2]